MSIRIAPAWTSLRTVQKCVALALLGSDGDVFSRGTGGAGMEGGLGT